VHNTVDPENTTSWNTIRNTPAHWASKRLLLLAPMIPTLVANLVFALKNVPVLELDKT